MKSKSIILVAGNIELENRFRQIINNFGADYMPVVFHSPIACLKEVKKRDIECVVIESRISDIAAEEFIRNFNMVNASMPVIVIDNSSRGEKRFRKPEGCSVVSVLPYPESNADALLKSFYDKLENELQKLQKKSSPEKTYEKKVTKPAIVVASREPILNRKVFNLGNKKFAADVLAIGSSTGGPLALEKVLMQLPENFPIPIVITQHMPPVFTKNLAERLNTKCRISVKEAEFGDILKAGVCYIAPGNFHMGFKKNNNEIEVELNQKELVNSCRPSVDVMFDSLHSICKGKILAVILTGMGFDGAKACVAIKNSGGFIVIQDQESSVVWGMPKGVYDLKAHDEMLPLTEIGDFITQKIMGPPRADRS